MHLLSPFSVEERGRVRGDGCPPTKAKCDAAFLALEPWTVLCVGFQFGLIRFAYAEKGLFNDEATGPDLSARRSM
jgi:hypothetical protein